MGNSSRDGCQSEMKLWGEVTWSITETFELPIFKKPRKLTTSYKTVICISEMNEVNEPFQHIGSM